jgi:hypothetical protein
MEKAEIICPDGETVDGTTAGRSWLRPDELFGQRRRLTKTSAQSSMMVAAMALAISGIASQSQLSISQRAAAVI